MTTFGLFCPAGGGQLHEEGDVLRSDRGETYPIICGVPIIIRGAAVRSRANSPSFEVIDQLLDALTLDPTCRPAVEQAFDREFILQEDWMQTEADQFLNRVAASHDGLRCALQLQADTTLCSRTINEDPSVSLSSIFQVRKIRPATSFSVNLRLKNVGQSTLSSKGHLPIMLAYHWKHWGRTAIEGHRTPLLDDLPPGRSISVPVFIDAPTKPGKYTLLIRALQEGVKWFEESLIEFDVKIAEGESTGDDPPWTQTGKQYDYMDDHFEAVRLLRKWISEHFCRPVERIVELGGNASPMTEFIQAPEKYNVDIDPYGMIIGNLARKRSESTVKFVVADGMALPMPPRSIDMLAMFATFHHFPDPVGLLSRLSDFVADDGLICLMCEPIGHVHRDTLPAEYLNEIRKGVNEQSFALWEYQQMFEAAQLQVVDAQIDVGSAKFALRPKRR